MSEARKCKCTAEEQTGTTEIECCNICGLPIKGERWSFDNKWQPMDTAPVDDLLILDVGLPYVVVGAWNEHEQQWVYSELEINRVDGNFNDPYFGNVYISNADVKGWMKLPEVDNAE